jgi:hypothetical protein
MQAVTTGAADVQPDFNRRLIGAQVDVATTYNQSGGDFGGQSDLFLERDGDGYPNPSAAEVDQEGRILVAKFVANVKEIGGPLAVAYPATPYLSF